MRKFTTAFLFFLAIFFLLPKSGVYAKVYSVEKGVYSLQKDEVIDDDLFVGAETIEIYGTVNGDVYAGAETIRINGIINGDLHLGAGMVFLSGNIRDDVYVGAGNVTINKANIGDSILIGAGNVSIDSESSIGGSVIAGSGTLVIHSPVARNVIVGAGSVDLNSEIGGEVRIGAGDISLGPDTKIAKDVYYTEGENQREIRISESASISGELKKIENRFMSDEGFDSAKTGISSILKTADLVMKLISLIGAFIVGYLCVRFFPKTFSASAELLTTSFFKSLGVGFLVFIATVPGLILLALTGIGIPLAGILLLIFLLGLYLSKIVVGVSLGDWLTDKLGWKIKSKYSIFAIGLLGVYLLKSFPVFGFFLSLLILWSGLGALTLYYKSKLSSK